MLASCWRLENQRQAICTFYHPLITPCFALAFSCILISSTILFNNITRALRSFSILQLWSAVIISVGCWVLFIDLFVQCFTGSAIQLKKRSSFTPNGCQSTAYIPHISLPPTSLLQLDNLFNTPETSFVTLSFLHILTHHTKRFGSSANNIDCLSD